MPPPLITLTTDFGLADPFVAAMKGVILSINPQAVIVDVTHSVRPQRIEQGAFLLGQACPYFPPGTIHVAVVDPGVGTPRRAIALQTPGAIYVGPDNGLLSPALPDEVRQQAGLRSFTIALPSQVKGVALTSQRFHRHPVSPTFHGRDIFAPVAAHLSLGVPLEQLGPPVGEVVALPPFRARRRPDGSLQGRVIHVDAFGNLITDVHESQLTSPRVSLEVAGRRIAALSPTYGEEQGRLVAVLGSAGFLEIALVGGNAAQELGADIGEQVVVRLAG